jgi:hypothetical protein
MRRMAMLNVAVNPRTAVSRFKRLEALGGSDLIPYDSPHRGATSLWLEPAALAIPSISVVVITERHLLTAVVACAASSYQHRFSCCSCFFHPSAGCFGTHSWPFMCVRQALSERLISCGALPGMRAHRETATPSPALNVSCAHV